MRLDNILPLFDRILIKKVNEEKTESGIYIPLNAEDDNTYKAEVLAVGDVVTAKYVSKGQIVVVGKYAGVELAKDKGVSIINVKDILGIVTE